MDQASSVLSLSEVFTLFFVMLGPVRVLAPFAKLYTEAPAPEVRRLALHAFAVAVAGVMAGGFLGGTVLDRWNVSVPVLLLAGGLVFLLVALKVVLSQYEEPQSPAPGPRQSGQRISIVRLAFPGIVPPYGIAAAIVLIAASEDWARTLGVTIALLAVLGLDLLAMLMALAVIRAIGTTLLEVAGAILAVLQVALALQFIVAGLEALGALPTVPG